MIPDWRMKAPPGVALAQAKMLAELPTGTVTPIPPGMPTVVPKSGPMGVVLRPNVRDRWLASQIAYFTPQIVENTFRGAMTGNLLAQWLLFDLMEQTWPRLSKNL